MYKGEKEDGSRLRRTRTASDFSPSPFPPPEKSLGFPEGQGCVQGNAEGSVGILQSSCSSSRPALGDV